MCLVHVNKKKDIDDSMDVNLKYALKSDFLVPDNHTCFHTGEKPDVQCHTGERPCVCDGCDIGFNLNLCFILNYKFLNEHLFLSNNDIHIDNQSSNNYTNGIKPELYQMKNTFHLSHYLYVAKKLSNSHL